MTNQQILERAIRKAIDGGWDNQKFNETWVWHDESKCFLYRRMPPDDYDQEEFSLNNLIFNHDFAKALWGDGLRVGEDDGFFGEQVIDRAAWKYHLEHMVIADDPIKYLGEHLGEGNI